MRLLSCILVIVAACCLCVAQQNSPQPSNSSASHEPPALSPQDQEFVDRAKQFEAAKKNKDMDYFRRTLTDDFT